jgi:hypothetical protein
MYLIQILLPVQDNEGTAFGPELYREVREELSSRFGGLTAFTRAPAEGHWEEEGKTTRDDIVVFEVMADDLTTGWWQTYRHRLERMFRQDVIVIRAHAIQLL